MAYAGLSDQEMQDALPAMNEILDYLAVMQGYAGCEPSIVPLANPLVNSAYFKTGGQDALNEASNVDGVELIANAVEKDGRFVVIPNVL